MVWWLNYWLLTTGWLIDWLPTECWLTAWRFDWERCLTNLCQTDRQTLWQAYCQWFQFRVYLTIVSQIRLSVMPILSSSISTAVPGVRCPLSDIENQNKNPWWGQNVSPPSGRWLVCHNVLMTPDSVSAVTTLYYAGSCLGTNKCWSAAG